MLISTAKEGFLRGVPSPPTSAESKFSQAINEKLEKDQERKTLDNYYDSESDF